MNRTRRVFPRRTTFHGTVFSQPVFWSLVILANTVGWTLKAWGIW